jgi:hypothetical protein
MRSDGGLRTAAPRGRTRREQRMRASLHSAIRPPAGRTSPGGERNRRRGPASSVCPHSLTCRDQFCHCSSPPPSGVEVALTLRGCKSLLPARTRSTGFVPFVRFGPGARTKGERACEVPAPLSHIGSSSRVPLRGPAPAPGRHWLRYLCPTRATPCPVLIFTCARTSQGGSRDAAGAVGG